MGGAAIRVAAALSALALPGAAQDLPAFYRVADVAGNDVLNVRLAPEAGADILGELAPDARGIEVTALSEDGAWARINLNEGAGWAAFRYLSPEPGASWRELGAGLSCFGTEPFWALGLAPGGAEAAWGLPEGGSRSLGPARLWPGPDYPASLGTGFGEGGFAAIRAEECSDGMSDRLYGLSILLFLAEEGAYSGCCSLSP